MKKIIIPGPHKKKQATGDAEDLKEEELRISEDCGGAGTITADINTQSHIHTYNLFRITS